VSYTSFDYPGASHTEPFGISEKGDTLGRYNGSGTSHHISEPQTAILLICSLSRIMGLGKVVGVYIGLINPKKQPAAIIVVITAGLPPLKNDYLFTV
jgi:hypothetical protein